mmetsp:Transcript_1011/g.2107  ORF Transcript_1011/g.2107 Transcript_1011/m.2107 type:complete len:306 (-) Transcript_1011:42-959(-)
MIGSGISVSLAAPGFGVASVLGRQDSSASGAKRAKIVAPSDSILTEPGCLKGKGIVQFQEEHVATVCGTVERINKLVHVKPIKHRYSGNVGDVVVGRVVDVLDKSWRVDIGSSTHASLPLGAVALPDAEQRKRTDEDALRMTEVFAVNEVLSAEVQKVQDSGDVVLQTRTARYGKLQNGLLVQVPQILVSRQSQHIVSLAPPMACMVVLGNNGWVWVCKPPKRTGDIQSLNFSQMEITYDQVALGERERICRVRNCIECLAQAWLDITVNNIAATFQESVSLKLPPKDILIKANAALVLAPLVSK